MHSLKLTLPPIAAIMNNANKGNALQIQPGETGRDIRWGGGRGIPVPSRELIRKDRAPDHKKLVTGQTHLNTN